MGTGTTLVTQVVADLRDMLASDEYPPGSRLPSETSLAEKHGVSRPTVRTAIKELEAQGLVRTKQGAGTFVAERATITAGLERLDSISDSIRAQGHEPGMIYKARVVRPLLPDEATYLERDSNSLALEIRRSILSDGKVVAYSYDLMPMEIYGEDKDPQELTGSLFEYLRTVAGMVPRYAVARVHAVSSSSVGWDHEPGQGDLYLLLDQVHYDAGHEALLYSRTYFIEGRYEFSMVRSG